MNTIALSSQPTKLPTVSAGVLFSHRLYGVCIVAYIDNDEYTVISLKDGLLVTGGSIETIREYVTTNDDVILLPKGMQFTVTVGNKA